MKKIDKQPVGFKFSRHRLEVLQQLGEVKHNGRSYRLMVVKTNSGENYVSLRLYNAQGKFIKQLLIDMEVYGKVATLMLESVNFISLT